MHMACANPKISIEIIKTMLEYKADPYLKDSQENNSFKIGIKNNAISTEITNLESKLSEKV